MSLGEKILALRKARGWSQEELAGRIGVTRQALSRWESSAAVPDTVNVVQLADLFGVSCDYLLRPEWTEDRPAAPQGRQSTERRIVAWAVMVLGAGGLLTMMIIWSLDRGKNLTNMSFLPYWRVQGLLWLLMLCWAIILMGIALLHGGRLSAYWKELKKEIKQNWEVGYEEDKK